MQSVPAGRPTGRRSPAGASPRAPPWPSGLLADHGVGVLPGAAFGDDPAALRLRATTSLLYGRTDDERWAALRSHEPVGLPWMAGALDHVHTALASLLT
jgi:hypothetical protein